MAQKQKIEIWNDGYSEKTLETVYVERDLFIFKAPKGWKVGHVNSGNGVCGGKRWVKKSEALAYALRLLDYNENGLYFDWSGLTDSEFWSKNKTEFGHRAYEECING